MASPQPAPEMVEPGAKIPPPTVREAMGFGGFASAQLVGGEQGLYRSIQWARVMAPPNTTRRMRSG